MSRAPEAPLPVWGRSVRPCLSRLWLRHGLRRMAGSADRRSGHGRFLDLVDECDYAQFIERVDLGPRGKVNRKRCHLDAHGRHRRGECEVELRGGMKGRVGVHVE